MPEYDVQFKVTERGSDDPESGRLSPPLPVEADSAAEAVQEAVALAKRTVWASART